MSFVNPKIYVKETEGARRGKGVFADKKILKGELIYDTKGEAVMVAKESVVDLPGYCYEADDKHDMCPKDFNNPAPFWFTNHSCEPNVGALPDLYRTVAMRDIEEGEELTYDYAMTDSEDYEMECFCGKPNCRHWIQGSDWMIPELQEKYKGYFQKNIQEKIDALAVSKKP
ncbi:MAG: SET domain-containing protein [bacterium]|nr:SET domain-containing protein [bacterium]